MKKWIITLIALIFILLISLPYVLIPQNLVVSSKIMANAHPNAVFRALLKENGWHKWWPKDKTQEDTNSLFYGGYTYKITENFYNAIGISISKADLKRESRINVIPVNQDTALIVWEYNIQSSLNPFIRIKEHKESSSSEKAMHVVLKSMKSFLDNPENIYGITIKTGMSGDSTLISTRFATAGYPTTAEIYQHIRELQGYININHALEKNYPMLNVEKIDNNHYETMVAIPVNKELRSKGNWVFKRFIPWKVLTAEIRGGDSTINRAYKQFNAFIMDYGVSQMANSFESLVTDRSVEKDTAKWITRLYTPIP